MVSVRYLVSDVEKSIEFYTVALGFKLDQSFAPAMAIVSKGELTLWLSPGGSQILCEDPSGNVVELFQPK